VTDQRRRYERIESRLPCRLFIPDEAREGELKFEAFLTSRNLGLGGVFVESTFLLKAGLELWVELVLPNARLTTFGRVVHVIGFDDAVYPSGMGIEFLEMGSEDRETLMRDFTPPRYAEFYGSMRGELPHLEQLFAMGDVSLLLHLWEEWKIVRDGGPLATESGAPEPTPKR
jgi:hypothetical protein